MKTNKWDKLILYTYYITQSTALASLSKKTPLKDSNDWEESQTKRKRNLWDSQLRWQDEDDETIHGNEDFI